MGPPLYTRSVVDRNVVMRHIPVIITPLISHTFLSVLVIFRVARRKVPFSTADAYVSPGISKHGLVKISTGVNNPYCSKYCEYLLNDI
jgi:hypothetical protein